MYCRRCQYPLKLLRSRQCPECGQPFDPANPQTYDERPRDAVVARRWRLVLVVAMAVTILAVLWGVVWGIMSVREIRRREAIKLAEAQAYVSWKAFDARWHVVQSQWGNLARKQGRTDVTLWFDLQHKEAWLQTDDGSEVMERLALPRELAWRAIYRTTQTSVPLPAVFGLKCRDGPQHSSPVQEEILIAGDSEISGAYLMIGPRSGSSGNGRVDLSMSSQRLTTQPGRFPPRHPGESMLILSPPTTRPSTRPAAR